MSAEPPGAEDREHPRDPWRNTRVDELGEPLLPRWFAVLAVVLIPVGLAVGVVAFLNAGRGEVPVAERRPVGIGPLTTAVGDFEAGAAAPSPFEAPCAVVDGMQIAGQERDTRTLGAGLSAFCRRALEADVVAPLRRFGEMAGVVRFAVFERTAVDSTAREPGSGRVPVIYLNAKYSRTDPEWLAPLVAYEATMLAGDSDRAETVLRARQAELIVCRTLGLESRTPGCRDAAALLALPDPAAALGAAGYRP